MIVPGEDPGGIVLRDVMTREVESIPPAGSFGDALRTMVANDYTYLPVAEEAKDGLRFVGMSSLRTLLEHQIDRLANEPDSVTRYLSVDGAGND